MTRPSHHDAHAIDRMTLDLLQDAYFDVVAVLRGAQPKAAAAILAVMEQRTANTVARMRRDGSETVAAEVGARLTTIMEQAHGRVAHAKVA